MCLRVNNQNATSNHEIANSVTCSRLRIHFQEITHSARAHASCARVSFRLARERLGGKGGRDVKGGKGEAKEARVAKVARVARVAWVARVAGVARVARVARVASVACIPRLPVQTNLPKPHGASRLLFRNCQPLCPSC